MLDLLLFAVVAGTVLLAIGVNIGMVIGAAHVWLRRRW